MLHHNTQTDHHGVNLDRINFDNERVYNKDFGAIPFKAIVVAYYGKSQMIDVVYPRDGGTGFLSGIEVYGNHGDLLGSITTPDIGIEKTVDGYNLDPPDNPDRVEIGERKNSVECMVQRTVDGFAALGFRAVHEDNPLWLNSKAGRTITSYSDGSYYVHDKDGNSEFVHPGGLRIKIGDSPDPIVMEDAMPVHKNNKTKYADSTNYIIEHPKLSAKIGFTPDGAIFIENSEGKMGVTDAGKITVENSSGKLGVKIGGIIDEINKIIVAQGTGPDVAALETLKTEILEILG